MRKSNNSYIEQVNKQDNKANKCYYPSQKNSYFEMNKNNHFNAENTIKIYKQASTYHEKEINSSAEIDKIRLSMIKCKDVNN